MAAPAVGYRADGPDVLSDGPHVITNAAQGATKGSERGVADTSGVESTSQPTRGIRWPLRISTRRLVILAAIVLAIRIFVGEASVVPTASMEGTILVGDHLFMDKLLYGPEIPFVHWRLPVLKTIHRGDIIVFRYPKDVTETFLKRVTALGGDRLEIKNGVLYVNSQPVAEPYAVHHAPIHSPLESWGPTVVPEGKLFVMGDNRDNSSDSRDWGFVPMRNVIGVVAIITRPRRACPVAQRLAPSFPAGSVWARDAPRSARHRLRIYVQHTFFISRRSPPRAVTRLRKLSVTSLG